MAGGSNWARPKLAKTYGDDANVIGQKVFEELEGGSGFIDGSRTSKLIELAKMYAILDLAQAVREAEIGRRLDNIIDRM